MRGLTSLGGGLAGLKDLAQRLRQWGKDREFGRNQPVPPDKNYIMQRLRRQMRIPLNAQVRLVWTGETGEPCYAMAKAMNISESGLRLESKHAMAVRSYVNFQVENSDVQGSASVRSCQRQGMVYQIGLEFTGGMRWQPGPAAGKRPPGR